MEEPLNEPCSAKNECDEDTSTLNRIFGVTLLCVALAIASPVWFGDAALRLGDLARSFEQHPLEAWLFVAILGPLSLYLMIRRGIRLSCPSGSKWKDRAAWGFALLMVVCYVASYVMLPSYDDQFVQQAFVQVPSWLLSFSAAALWLAASIGIAAATMLLGLVALSAILG